VLSHLVLSHLVLSHLACRQQNLGNRDGPLPIV
jgi:hypothetical protein